MTNVAKDKLIFKLTKWTVCPNINVLYIFSEHLFHIVKNSKRIWNSCPLISLISLQLVVKLIEEKVNLNKEVLRNHKMPTCDYVTWCIYLC